ncbi:MAG: 3-dehydroquinate synthase [Clostridiales Family XIII bacterium]|jgi:3-dehydroquinate synthase|nr:3-dehydroquinate synthase [Clostridiales Family XIII bacterium]
MELLKVENTARAGSYDIEIGSGLIAAAGEKLGRFIPKHDKTVVVSDENVFRLYGERVMASLAKAGADTAAVIIPPGEASKTLKQLEAIYDLFGDIGLKRGGLVIALGGGVVGDIAGLAAATWMRGVPLVQLPTTLLAQVDSSVGGKTAIDTSSGKNMVGVFSRPAAVLADTETLSTLPLREYASGMAEVIKYGAIASAGLFERLESLNAGAAGEDIIAACCGIKADIVSEDEFDTGKRQLLNFGHTFGHALETKYGFTKYTHGEAVAQGMVIAAAVGESAGITPKGTADRILRLTLAQGLPAPETDITDLARYISHDKKSTADSVSLVLIRGIGAAVIHNVKFGEAGALLASAQTVIRSEAKR